MSRLQALTQDLAATQSDATFCFTHNPSNQIATRTLANDLYAFTGITAANKAYAVNGLNQYSAVAGTSHFYDANGNLVGDGASTFVYGAENRLISASGAKTATLTYDPLGRLRQVTGPASNTRFLYDGDELIAEYDAAATMTKRYIHGAGIDDPMVEYTGASLTSRAFLHGDHQGSIIAVSDASGNAATFNRYDEIWHPRRDQRREVWLYGADLARRTWAVALQGEALLAGAGEVPAGRSDRL